MPIARVAGRDVFRAPKGMLDVLPPASQRWSELVARFAGRAARFGYGLVVTPDRRALRGVRARR
ncbi:MAG: hypothetical protein KatS3mg009_2470 [Acidimicrobiia bacterium]|nr:MAG: hypothetical protein KatS3mg009_2470 [Acidimicrobiia bacterium]